MDDNDASVALWLKRVRDGDDQALAEIWQAFFPQLVRLARDRLKYIRRGVEDEEDAALSALKSFFRATREGRFPDLADRESLWRLLSEITHRKAVDIIRSHQAQKRGGGKVVGESAVLGPDAACLAPLDRINGGAVQPELAVMLNEQLQACLDGLSDNEMREIALAKLEGYTNPEIAQRIGRSLSTVERRLVVIRSLWMVDRES